MKANKYQKGLEKSRQSFWSKVKSLFRGKNEDIEAYLPSLEESLIAGDVSVRLAMEIRKKLADEVKIQGAKSIQQVDEIFLRILKEFYLSTGIKATEKIAPKDRPEIILFVGVNGSGKTTSVAKLASQYLEKGKKVLLVAADTFRAGAVEQLTIWSTRLKAEVISGREQEDPASVVYKALEKTLQEKYDYVLIDTAGRLQNKAHLMAELAKIRKIITKFYPEAPDDTFLVLDATTGQNGLRQAEVFQETTGLSGIILTKMDGTAKGGIVLTIRQQFGLPVAYLGLGESLDDLIKFNLDEYLTRLYKDDYGEQS